MECPGTLEWLPDGGKLLGTTAVGWPNWGWVKPGVNVGAGLKDGGPCGPEMNRIGSIVRCKYDKTMAKRL